MKVVVLLSGRGSNLGALLADCGLPEAGYRIVAVIADREAPGLALAQAAGVTTEVVVRAAFADRAAFEAALQDRIAAHAPDLIVLAGFMRVLSAAFVEAHADRMINIHPSLLPKYPGLDTHRRALEAGDADHGASVHLVIPALDAGPVLAQVRIGLPDAAESPDSIAARLLPREHRLLARCVRALASGWVKVQSGAFSIDGVPLTLSLQLDEDDEWVEGGVGRRLDRLVGSTDGAGA